VEALWRWSEQGRLPAVLDASSCALGLAREVEPYLSEENRERHAAMTVLDSVEWAHDQLLPALPVTRRVPSATIHPPCSVRHLGTTAKLEAIARALAEEVVTPAAATCCGYAGDRGMLHPELAAAATRDEAEELSGRSFHAHLSSNRTCEIGLHEGTGVPYSSFVYLLEEMTRE